MPSITRPGPLRNFTRIVLAILALSGVLALAYRDALTKNWANISVDASESGLEAIELPYSPHEAVQRVTSLVASLPRWMIVTVNGAEGSIQLVHTTRFWRFNDDVRLKFEPLGEKRCRMTGESRSRVGKADFGQNARNLKEVRYAVLAMIAAADQAETPQK